MARILDLNTVQCSIMDLTLRDADRTVVHLDMPTEALVQEFEAMLPEIQNIEKGDYSAVNKIYDVAAEIINVNLDMFKTTGRELRTKYGMNLMAALQFFNAYTEFLNSLNEEKN